MATPLKKQDLKGYLYARPVLIEAKLAELEELTRDEVVRRCSIRRRDDEGYIPSECLMYLVRACRLDNSDSYFERLYKLLLERVVRSLPRSESRDGTSVSLTKERIREYVLERFIGMLMTDRTAYFERLDYFEVRFDGALASLRKDGQEKAWREENRTVSLEFDEETGELSPEVEEAAGSFDPIESSQFREADYRSRLEAAIDALPVEQIRIVQMLSKGIPIDSKEPSAMTIAKALGKSEKTIRLHRDKAFAALRAILKRSE